MKISDCILLLLTINIPNCRCNNARISLEVILSEYEKEGYDFLDRFNIAVPSPGKAFLDIYPYFESASDNLIGINLTETVTVINFKEQESKRLQTLDLLDSDIVERYGKFDFINSFFSFQWMSNQSLAAKNLLTLLNPGGHAFIVIVTRSPVEKVFDKVAELDEWRRYYLKGAPKKLNIYAYMADPETEFFKIMSDAGFKFNFKMKLERDNKFSIEKFDEFGKRIRAIDPYLSRIPDELKGYYINDVLKLVYFNLNKPRGTGYSLIVASLSNPLLSTPELLSLHSKYHVREAKHMLATYGDKLEWRGYENVIGIGSGSGDIASAALYPIVKSKHSKLLGVDANKEMSAFAKKKFSNGTSLQFKVLNLENSTECLTRFGWFDKAFALFNIYWTKNHSTRLQNIYSILKPGGQAFFLIAAKSGMHIAWDVVSKYQKWSDYLKGVPDQINIYEYMDDPLAEFTKKLKDIGFSVEFSVMEERNNAFKSENETEKEILQRIKAIDPYLFRIPESKKNEYLRDVLKLIKATGAAHYTAMVAVVTKTFKPILDDPILYSKYTADFQTEATNTLDSYGDRLKWKTNERVIDITSRSGDITYNVIYPIVKSHNASLVAISMSRRMTIYANKKYGTEINFELLKLEKAEEVYGQFDKIFSFFSLYWMNYRSLTEKMFSLLKPGGQAFLHGIVKSDIFIAWDTVTKYKKWRPYLKGAPEKVNIYAYVDNPLEEINKVLLDVGFTVDFSVALKGSGVNNKGNSSKDDDTEHLQAIDPYVFKLPLPKRKEYIRDVFEFLKSKKSTSDHTAVVIVLSKPLPRRTVYY